MGRRGTEGRLFAKYKTQIQKCKKIQKIQKIQKYKYKMEGGQWGEKCKTYSLQITKQASGKG